MEGTDSKSALPNRHLPPTIVSPVAFKGRLAVHDGDEFPFFFFLGVSVENLQRVLLKLAKKQKNSPSPTFSVLNPNSLY
jgi:hypothetical protein